MRLFTPHNEEQIANNDYKSFELLYDKYAPKAYGFITQYADTKEEADEFLKNVFLRAWDNIKTFDEHPEKKFVGILLSECRPLYKNKRSIEY